LSDIRFDELSSENQETLLAFYPDARFRFGNRKLEVIGQDRVQSFIPMPFRKTVERGDQLREEVLRYRDDFRHLSNIMAPIGSRKRPIPVGWMQMGEGYLLRLLADSYTGVHIDIYVPKEKVDLGKRGRFVSSIKEIKFRPWEWVGLPGKGQTVAISTRSTRKRKSLSKDPCAFYKTWRPKKCEPISDPKRQKIIETADPKNFPKTWYQSPPTKGDRIEDSTDCSSFVHEIYRRSGFDYPYSATACFSSLNIFEEVSDSDMKPADLILYKGHIGILDQDGKVISATRGGQQMYSMHPPTGTLDDDFIPSITRYPKNKAGSGAWKILRWRCP
jgi:cell wall-associated NlpC family hydrolase